jgi:toxin FitB
VGFLVDTNVISELRRSDRCAPSVRAWFESVSARELYLSILTIAEIHVGAEAGAILARWVEDVEAEFHDRVLGIDRDIARTWAKLSTPDPLPFIDGFSPRRRSFTT